MLTTLFSLCRGKKNKITLCFAFFLLGCQTSPDNGHSVEKKAGGNASIQSATAPSAVPSPSIEREAVSVETRSKKYTSESEKLQQCQSQLDALKVMSPAEYAKMRNAFDYLMNGAAQYANLRQKINPDTQDTVDALYRYRANLLCAQIAQTLLNGLTRRGEARP